MRYLRELVLAICLKALKTAYVCGYISILGGAPGI